MGTSNTERLPPGLARSAAYSISETVRSPPYKNTVIFSYAQGQEPFWLDVATVHLIAVAVMPGHSLTGICYYQGKAVGCPLGDIQIQEQCEKVVCCILERGFVMSP